MVSKLKIVVDVQTTVQTCHLHCSGSSNKVFKQRLHVDDANVVHAYRCSTEIPNTMAITFDVRRRTAAPAWPDDSRALECHHVVAA